MDFILGIITGASLVAMAILFRSLWAVCVQADEIYRNRGE